MAGPPLPLPAAAASVSATAEFPGKQLVAAAYVALVAMPLPLQVPLASSSTIHPPPPPPCVLTDVDFEGSTTCSRGANGRVACTSDALYTQAVKVRWHGFGASSLHNIFVTAAAALVWRPSCTVRRNEVCTAHRQCAVAAVCALQGMRFCNEPAPSERHAPFCLCLSPSAVDACGAAPAVPGDHRRLVHWRLWRGVRLGAGLAAGCAGRLCRQSVW